MAMLIESFAASKAAFLTVIAKREPVPVVADFSPTTSTVTSPAASPVFDATASLTFSAVGRLPTAAPMSVPS